MFKEECTKFLDNITAMRSTAVNQAVAEAIEKEHTPYVKEMTVALNAVITEETAKTEALIKSLQADLARKKASFTEETQKAIDGNKNKVIEVAEAKAKSAYDNFILGVGKLVDETKII